jgi:DNA-binding winged helix-turn-helix (wHTH) protein
LQDQPFQVLAWLLERPGELVTREEIQQKLWPRDTYVAFDDGLNTAIKELRSALSDTADSPRFIETVPRRGYRFVAPVNIFPEPQLATGRSANLTLGLHVCPSSGPWYRQICPA